MLGSSPPPCSLSNHPRSPTTPLPSPIHRPNPSWTAPKPHPGRAELPRCCRSRSRLAARPSVTSCSRSAPLPCSRLPSPRLPLPAGSPRGKAEPVAGSGHGSCCHPRLPRGCSLCPPAGRQHRRTRGRGFLRLREDPTRMRSTQGGCLGSAVAFVSPPRALPDGTASCRRLGSRGSGQSILAAWGRRSRPAAGGRGLKSHLTTTCPLPLCPPRPQLLSESQANMARLVSSVSDVLDTLQKERGGARPRLKADLQRAPARGARPRGCSNGEKGSSSCPGRGCCHGAALCTSLGGRNAPGMGKPAWRALGAVGGLGRREMCPGWVFTVQLQLSSLGSQP